MNKSTYRRSIKNLWKLYLSLGQQKTREEMRVRQDEVAALFSRLYNADPEFDYATVETLRIMLRIQSDLFPITPQNFGQHARVKLNY